jgi:N-methylhydantoinase A
LPENGDGYFVSSDIGGTFTDTVVMDGSGAVSRHKAATTPEELVGGIVETFRLAAEARELSVADFLPQVRLFSHGTTLATNALLQRKGARTGLIQTAGAGDTLWIMRGYKGFGLDERTLKSYRTLLKRTPVIERDLVREVPERVDYQGRVLMPLDREAARTAVRELVAEGVDAIAVSLLWCFKHPEHEQAIAEIVREEAPDVYVTLSSEILARMNEYARTVTTAVNAYLGPAVRHATSTLEGSLRDQGLDHPPLLMQSNGGVGSVAQAGEQPVNILLSGPVGGIVGSKLVADHLGEANVVTTDMGGTSFDVGLVVDGRPLLQATTVMNGQPIAVPSVAVQTIGAGGGSIARVTEGTLAVGPDSAGANPGPACYGRGGTEPTVTDADVVLGLINPDNFLGGRIKLDRDLAVQAVRTKVAEPLGMSVEEAAEGIKRIVDSKMTDLIRSATIHKGYDPREFVLIAFGGAGPVHAHAYGATLGVKQVVVPVTASVHSAYGILASDLVVTRELSRSFFTPPGSTGAAAYVAADDVNPLLQGLEEDARATLGEQGPSAAHVHVTRFVDMRFRFQIHELTVEIPEFPLTPGGLDALVAQFIADYEARFGEGSAFTAAGVEMVTWRVVATGELRRPALEPAARNGNDGSANGCVKAVRRHPVYWGGEWKDADVYDERVVREGATLEGPAIVELPDTTVVVGPDQHAGVDAHGNIVIAIA